MSERSETKACPDCAETVKAEARVCRFCGYRFDGSSAAEDEDGVESDVGSSGFNSVFAGRGMVIWGVVSGALAVIGAFGPWVTALGTSFSGTNGSGDGWGLVALMVLGVLYFYGNREKRRAGFGALLFGGLSAALTIYDREHAARVISHGGVLARALIQIGWGLNLAVAASLSLTLCGLVWTRIPGD